MTDLEYVKDALWFLIPIKYLNGSTSLCSPSRYGDWYTACKGPVYKNGTLIFRRHKTGTCARCNAIIELNQLYRRWTGKYATIKDLEK